MAEKQDAALKDGLKVISQGYPGAETLDQGYPGAETLNHSQILTLAKILTPEKGLWSAAPSLGNLDQQQPSDLAEEEDVAVKDFFPNLGN